MIYFWKKILAWFLLYNSYQLHTSIELYMLESSNHKKYFRNC